MRVYELAKEMKVTSREILDLCRAEGIEASNHMNALDPGQVNKLKKSAGKRVPAQKAEAAPRPEAEPAAKAPLRIRAGTTVKELAGLIGLKPNELIAKLMTLGVFATINQPLEAEDLALATAEFGLEARVEQRKAGWEDEDEEPSRPEDLEPRSPVVTLLGHVDHGKTTLLDRIRKTDVAAGESGGITQHIGAYTVETGGKHVVFLDTPGHEAFTAMRARGANVTDVVVLVVAADDGMMPQTAEAIDHANAAGVPVVIAVNKIDLPNANPQRVRQQLAMAGLNPEEWGGDTIFVDISAKTGENIENLLEMLALQSEILELKAAPKRPARGTVLEIERSAKKGVLAHLLVQEGTLRKGDAILCGNTYGKVRTLHDHTGSEIKEAGPSVPVRITGLQDVPEAGDHFRTVQNIQKARAAAEARRLTRREETLVRRKHITLENLYASIAEGSLKDLRLVIKGDVHGSVEALEGALNRFDHEEVRMNILHRGVGAINESDILLADASDAIVIGFHVVCSPLAASLAEEKGVDVETYSVIYEAVDSMKSALEGMLEPEKRETVVGRLTVRATFKVSKVGTVAGCFVDDGTVSRRDSIRAARNGIVVYSGSIASLKRFKDDVSQVSSGYECGIRLAGFDDVKVGDTLEAYSIEEVAKKL